MFIVPRTARLAAPNHPHHITHRGVDRQPVFHDDQDYRDYLLFLGELTRRTATGVWAYCLMPNHVHLILTPSTAEGLSRSVAETARRFARTSNRRRSRQGPLWQSRFYSVALDELHFLEAARYVLLNPVRARLASRVELWPWSSFRAHQAGADDLVDTAPLAQRIGTVDAFVAVGLQRDVSDRIRAATRTGRPLGNKTFSDTIARAHGVTLPARGRGRPSQRDRPGHESNSSAARPDCGRHLNPCAYN
ncbi:transposase [Bradyrhizobium genosp. SA-3]|uniref:REP-associated tyrosine transposase n=1 Tax=Bradyrhizobium genosp. SA-3 TaxID=508868 RepID=UPI0010296C2F|nr:transposase [Bradyrhizobium genosp. SA-3]RZN10793.1 transposase [Bradyrhizobium genosp. SA-3]